MRRKQTPEEREKRLREIVQELNDVFIELENNLPQLTSFDNVETPLLSGESKQLNKLADEIGEDIVDWLTDRVAELEELQKEIWRIASDIEKEDEDAEQAET